MEDRIREEYLQELLQIALQMLNIHSEVEMESYLLQDITRESLYLKLSPINYCLYDDVDEFLEKNGIEISYSSNFIKFKKIKYDFVEIDKNSDYYEGIFGLIIIGWGDGILGLFRDKKIELLSNYRFYGKIGFHPTYFDSPMELDEYIHQKRRSNYKELCEHANYLLLNIYRQLDAILIGLKRFVRGDEINLNWFYYKIRDKISHIVEVDHCDENGLKQLSDRLRKTG